MTRWLGKLGVPPKDIRDVAQSTLLEAVKSFPAYDPSLARPERWLNRIALHTALHYRDRAAHRHEELHDTSDAVDESASAFDAIASSERVSLLRGIIERIPEHLASVLIDHDLHEVAMVEIARARNLPLSTAYKWRARALAEAGAIAKQLEADRDRLDGARRAALIQGGRARRSSGAPRKTWMNRSLAGARSRA